MTQNNLKKISVVIYQRNYLAEKWRQLVNQTELDALFVELSQELTPLGFDFSLVNVSDVTMDIKGYGDLLNSVRLSCPAHGIGNICLGHVIGASQHLNLAEDVRRGVNRVCFAPETIEPQGSDKVVCHNCGCGC
ncbi:hypothetical protein [Pelovirga terrestris]|uniref:Uncharacterized protein n=1 Tax=Pelovirga terrestris TaxID=2771352 RepID=A0A8J6R4P9_9BACT|nr:hypothetical protein [Pelovirga terrestris]MBD1399459.1 hypothetical protein [Pelovirga terrestris]